MTAGARFGRGGALAALLLAWVAPSMAAPRPRWCPGCILPPRLDEPYGVPIPLEPFGYEPSPDGGGAPGDLPDEGGPGVPQASPRPRGGPYPQGFVLDVPVRPGDAASTGERPDRQLVRYREIATALAQCWNPPATFGDRPWRQVTLRISFRRDGTVNGMPRIPFVEQGLTDDARSDLTRSLLDALRRCTPLPFSPSLGGAIAGQVFALRFIEQDQD